MRFPVKTGGEGIIDIDTTSQTKGGDRRDSCFDGPGKPGLDKFVMKKRFALFRMKGSLALLIHYVLGG